MVSTCLIEIDDWLQIKLAINVQKILRVYLTVLDKRYEHNLTVIKSRGGTL